MNTIKINKISPNGYEGGVTEYDAKFSPIYCLCLYVCQHVLHIDYMNKNNIENVRKRIQLGKYNKGCHYWDGNDTTYSAIAPKDRDVLTGQWGSKYDYEPNYMK
nr:MAG TPA: hypothetical protein [Caudoviricetes sp.]